MKDGENVNQEKVYKATKISVSPGSLEELDEGGCGKSGAQNFVEDGSGDKAGLGFRLQARCQPTHSTTDVAGSGDPTGARHHSETVLTDGSVTYGAHGFGPYIV